MPLRNVGVSTRGQWRKWLIENHDKEPRGIWLVFHKKGSGKPSLDYEEAVEEALCFGWIDSVVRRLDDETYCRKFTPRRDASQWSPTNRKRADKVIEEGRMTQFGRAKIDAAKRLGRWETEPRPAKNLEVPRDWSEALAPNGKAAEFFAELTPTHQQRFIGWIVAAKRPETRAKRIEESLALLARGERLGLK